MPTAEELIEKLTKKVDGEKGAEEKIVVFTLSTCMWCKKCKRFLNEKNIKYRYVDVDQIDYQEKAILLEYLRENYQSRVSYPFLICESGHVVGYDPNQYMELFTKGGS
ncbi:MAG: glutaredoxin family protein [Promethearchaeota archaeon]